MNIKEKEQLAVIEEKLRQNDKDHALILETINHNCKRNEELFSEVKEMMKEALTNKANKWVEPVIKTIVGAFVTIVVGVTVAIVSGHLTF